VSRKIDIADVRRAGRYAWNDVTGELRVFNPDRAHFGFWVRSEADGRAVYTHLMSPALGSQADELLVTWKHEDGCTCGLCKEAP
jgi:hypothetical protein